MRVAGGLAALAAAPSLEYLPGMTGGKPLGAALFLLVLVLMPAGWLIGRRLARTPRARVVVAWGIAVLSLLGIATHVAIRLSDEPLAPLALIVYLLPVQFGGLVAVLTVTAWRGRSSA